MRDQPEALSSQIVIAAGGIQTIQWSGELFNHVDQGLPMWSSDGDRKIQIPVTFEIPFAGIPSIFLGLIGIDSAHDQNLRFLLQATGVTAHSFKIEFSTWGDTHIARASVSWQAMGHAPVGTDPGSV